MKTSGTLLLLLVAAMAIAVATKPDDQQCISQLRDQVSQESGELLAMLAVNRVTLQVEDHIFFKQIYTTAGAPVGYGAFGCVWASK